MINTLGIKADKIVIGNGETLNDSWIGIENGVIKEVSKDPLLHKYEEIIDASDKVVIPGLLDAHVHLASTAAVSEGFSTEYLTLKASKLAAKSLLSGFTTLGDAGSTGNTSFALRQAIGERLISGPRIMACGSIITMTGGRVKKGAKLGSNPFEISGENEARRAARTLLMYGGADFLKLGATGALSNPLTSPLTPQLTIEEMQAVVHEAKKCGKPVHSHCYGKDGIGNSLEAGVDVIVHGQSLETQQFEYMRKHNRIFIPTLFAYKKYLKKTEPQDLELGSDRREIIEGTNTNFKNALDQGVTIALGTDISSRHENVFGKHAFELVEMVRLGMSEKEALKAGTYNTARALGVADQLGTIEVGKYADLLILNNNPIRDIEVLTEKESFNRIILRGTSIYTQK